MRDEFTWMLFLILPLVMVTSFPVHEDNGPERKNFNQPNTPTPEGIVQINEEVISVSITSSIAIGRGKKLQRNPEPSDDLVAYESVSATPAIAKPDSITVNNGTNTELKMSPEMAGANIEFIKQLHSKKEARGSHHLEQVHPFQLQIKNYMSNDTNTESTEQSNLKENLAITDKIDDIHENIENIPLGRSVALSPSSQNYIQGLPLTERGQRPRLTTVSFNILHDTPKTITNFNEHRKPVGQFPDFQRIYSEPPKIYSQPAKVYSEPAKIYSEPAKIYSEPAKIYSEPAKVYSEPAKIYSEPAKFYSPAASLNLPPHNMPIPTPWQQTETPTETTVETTPVPTTSLQPHETHRPEKNYEVREKDSVHNDQQHSEQEPENCQDDNCKVGYVVEGRQYRKYRVEERTSDGFIVGEYGVVRNEDGALRGVRYTADGDASPTLIHDALMKFLQL